MKHHVFWRDLLRLQVNLKSELPTDLQMESIPLKNLSFLVEDIHIKTKEASQNTHLYMQEFLAINKFLQNIQGELLNNTTKLMDIDRHNKSNGIS